MNKKSNVRIITLGCAKNEVDSEEIAGVLHEAGYLVDGAAETSDFTIINTCGFLKDAEKEGVKAIRQALRDREKGKTGRVIVAGCLSQRLGQKMKEVAPGADAYVGVGQMARFAEIVSKVQSLPKQGSPLLHVTPPHHRWASVHTRARTGAPWSAYLKISEGCDHRCTFCTIPSFRGAHQSKPLERVLHEAIYLATTGAKELNLIAQDVTQYGYDLYRQFTLPKLLKHLNAIDGIEWIRLLYFYPNRLTDEVLDSMKSLPKVLPYIDIPLQHSHPEILKAMKRPWDGERYLKLFEKVRKYLPECAIRSTFIVGFPGETEREFQHLLDFLSESKLDRVGAFMYSRESGTLAYEMKKQVDFSTRRERYQRLMQHQQTISLSKNEEWIGRRIKVLVESDDQTDQYAIGRSFRDAPEIDGVVMIDNRLSPGMFVDVEITKADEYDLVGVVTSEKNTLTRA